MVRKPNYTILNANVLAFIFAGIQVVLSAICPILCLFDKCVC